MRLESVNVMLKDNANPAPALETPPEYVTLALYQAGELSLGAACELAGLDYYAFMDFCRREGVQLQTQTPEELEAEFARL